ncbi:HTH cro/C1-type domain-containing protein [Morganella morganii]|uniref:helix-turn-helix transcriptional regulator n=1 Tax=Morganella morganii TaxID=582 RepID=UPI0031AC77B6
MLDISPQEMLETLTSFGYTQTQIQEITGVRQSILSRILSGKHKDPRNSNARAIEKLYVSVVNTKKA